MKLLFRHLYIESWHRYIPDAISYHAVQYKVDGYPSGDSDFEEEKILGTYLSDVNWMEFAHSVAGKLNSSFVKERIISSESWDAEIIGDKVEMRFTFAEDDPNDEDYAPILILPRREVAYAAAKWVKFLEREFDPEYSEIIDTEDVYRENP